MQLATISLGNVDIETDNLEYIVNKLVDSTIFKAGKVLDQSDSTASLYYLIDWKSIEDLYIASYRE